MDPVQLINFLKEYRVLECSCCTSVFGSSTKQLEHCIAGGEFQRLVSTKTKRELNFQTSTTNRPKGKEREEGRGGGGGGGGGATKNLTSSINSQDNK
ncbi:hypothetical protein Ocin01_07185 [Orchesella cincta]|uniref:Uncharacterized protein n=1 Tax=Orchesella cincta TaxID=48709 RepID=A0A1D2N3J0_ORCCI|nr:hypothetical protein Ocin01_07185 [Orchesella cincta]